MRTIVAVAAVAVLAVGLAAQDKKDGKKFAPKDGKFAVDFPGAKAPTAQTKTASGLTQTFFTADHDKGKGGYLVSYGELPAEVVKAPKPEQILESGEKGLVEYFKAKVTKSGATAVGAKKYPAREIIAEKDGGAWNARGKLVLVGNRLYQVFVFGPKDFITGPEADAFLASFEITE